MTIRTMSRCPVILLAILPLGMALPSCTGVKEQLGLTKSAPDEFTVVTKAPLIIPPDLTLRPPRPGASGPGDAQARERARRALVGAAAEEEPSPAASETAAQPDPSRAEASFLKKAGADEADPRIRTVIRRETLAVAEKDPSFIRRLMFWRDDSEEEPVVDAEKEAERLREAAAKGGSPAEGEVPVIERKSSIFKRAF